MAEIDAVRRECEDLGTSLAKSDKPAREAIAVVHAKAMLPDDKRPTVSSLFKELDAFRSRFKIDPKVAASYRPEE